MLGIALGIWQAVLGGGTSFPAPSIPANALTADDGTTYLFADDGTTYLTAD